MTEGDRDGQREAETERDRKCCKTERQADETECQRQISQERQEEKELKGKPIHGQGWYPGRSRAIKSQKQIETETHRENERNRHRSPWLPAAGGRKFPGWGGRGTPAAEGPARPAHWIAGKAEQRADRGRKFRASQSPAAPAAAGRRAPGSREAASPGPPVPLPRDQTRALGSVPWHWLRDLAAPSPSTPAAQRGLVPDNHKEERGSERETETCYRGQGSREEGTAVLARASASDQAQQGPTGRAECRARRARAHLEPAPARQRRAQRRLPPEPLSSHFPASSASRLRPRPAPERGPHSAAAG
ncbi:uncharacterized protein LOC134369256 [Cynocephalus volans]|uniref:uncharacterized protein LOC134369256 n=1 Tax=Cynocephalus volans TaxID=110931 RepID=UPI002FC9C48A